MEIEIASYFAVSGVDKIEMCGSQESAALFVERGDIYSGELAVLGFAVYGKIEPGYIAIKNLEGRVLFAFPIPESGLDFFCVHRFAHPMKADGPSIVWTDRLFHSQEGEEDV